MRFFNLQPTKQRKNSKDIFGFDIETYDDNKKMYCCSIWHENPSYCKTFFEKDEFIEYMKLKRFCNSYVSATNLSFDFFGVFFNKEDVAEFEPRFRGSNLLYAKSHIHKGKFHIKRPTTKPKSITFIDTMNYACLSVEKLGKILNIPKLKKPVCLGKFPKNKAEHNELVTYNMRDSEISAKALSFFFDSFYKIGASPQVTIASTSMSLFKNKYLNKTYYRHPVYVLDEQFKGYYGGRTEVFSRGRIEDYYSYDVNSLYPFVMRNFSYPDPNTLRYTRNNDIGNILNFEGMSKVTVDCPYMEYPLLPYRYDHKLYFPIGKFTSWYTHVELREAIKLGYTILKVYKTYWYKSTCEPFKDLIDDLYKQRLIYKAKNNPMEYVVKILMNSLYGKFGQKFRDKDNWIPAPKEYEDWKKLDILDEYNGFLRVNEPFREPAGFTIPIWASYVTSYARMHLHNLITLYKPVYVDTDSILTTRKVDTSSGLGALKLEYKVKQGTIVKPKMYGYTYENKSKVKVKGLGVKLSYKEFVLELLATGKRKYNKFAKFKEALRRGLLPNQIIEIEKNFNLEDNKRKWLNKFGVNDFEVSFPLSADVIHDNIKKTQKLNPLITA